MSVAQFLFSSYLCSWCGKTFTEACKLKRHLNKLHHDKVKEAQENAAGGGGGAMMAPSSAAAINNGGASTEPTDLTSQAAAAIKKVSKKKKNLETIIENKFPPLQTAEESTT